VFNKEMRVTLSAKQNKKKDSKTYQGGNRKRDWTKKRYVEGASHAGCCSSVL